MAERGDEIEATVNSIVNDVSAIKTALVMEVPLKLVIDVADNGAETGWQKYTSYQTYSSALYLNSSMLLAQPQNTKIKSTDE